MSGGQNAVLGLVGRKGSGKSTLGRRIAERLPRVFVFDPMGEHGWVANTFADADDADEFLRWAAARPTFSGRLVPQWDEAQAFAELAELVYEIGGMALMVEEAPMVCRAGHLPPEFARLVRLGRHRRVGLLWTAQRMAEVSRTLSAMTDGFGLFASTEPRDLEETADRCGREAAERVARLPLHGLLGWDVIARREVGAAGLLRLAQAPFARQLAAAGHGREAVGGAEGS
ncbi:MAG: hypothetical protein ACRD2F_02045 [Terriglobales bacterium]